MKFSVTIRKEGIPDEKRIIEAPTRFAVYEQVQGEQGSVIKLDEASGTFALPSWLFLTIGTGVKHAEITRLAKNISAMLSAGLSLSRALSTVERQSNNKSLRAIVAGVSESIKRGSSFHEALAAYPRVFNTLFVAMIKAGEESGSLANALSVIGLQMGRSEELVRKIRGAMIYPAIVLIAIVIVGILMLIYVVPTLTNTFTELGVKIPVTTQMIVDLSNFFVNHTVLVFTTMIAIIVGGSMFVRSPLGSRAVLAIALRLPVINDLVRETYTARAARALSSLLSSGVPILEALSITEEVVHARTFAHVIEEARMRVQKGEPLSSSFIEHTKLYPLLMGDMLAVGEETGKVADMLGQIAEFYEQDVAEKTKDLSTIVEPILMLVIGTVVGIFAVSMIAPIYSLSSVI